jgi:hypothetical protein
MKSCRNSGQKGAKGCSNRGKTKESEIRRKSNLALTYKVPIIFEGGEPLSICVSVYA